MTIKEAIERRDRYQQACSWHVPEADETFNDLNRDIIASYKEAYRRPMLVHLLPECKMEEVPEKCLNFCAQCIVPYEDDKLRKDLIKYKELGVSLMFDTVYCRVMEIGGAFLSWS